MAHTIFTPPVLRPSTYTHALSSVTFENVQQDNIKYELKACMTTEYYKPLATCWLLCTCTATHVRSQHRDLYGKNEITHKSFSATQQQQHIQTYTVYTHIQRISGKVSFFWWRVSTFDAQLKLFRPAWSVTGAFSIFVCMCLRKTKETMCKRHEGEEKKNNFYPRTLSSINLTSLKRTKRFETLHLRPPGLQHN